MVKKQSPKTASKKRTASPKAPSVGDDFKNAALVVSVAINIAVLTGWLAIKVTTQYDLQVAQFLFSR
jgi:2-C-methyl-D-erythritol 4-phosphate cytidylyltransferase